MRDLVIIGAGGYAQELVWVADDINSCETRWNILGYLDPAQPQRKGQTLYDRPILGGYDDFCPDRETWFCCGIGNPAARQRECEEAERRGLKPATLIHPKTVIARHVSIGEGCVVGAGVILTPYSSLGRHCALNIGVGVGHNSSVGDYAVLSPYAQVLGNATVGRLAFLGANSTVQLGRRIGAGSILGANSYLLTDLEADVSAIGIPARVFSRHSVAV